MQKNIKSLRPVVIFCSAAVAHATLHERATASLLTRNSIVTSAVLSHLHRATKTMPTSYSIATISRSCKRVNVLDDIGGRVEAAFVADALTAYIEPTCFNISSMHAYAAPKTT